MFDAYFQGFTRLKLSFTLLVCSFSDTYKVRFCMRGFSLTAACVRHAEGVRQHGAKPSAQLSFSCPGGGA
ncbi:MAG: hypothetical protein NZ455_00945 [Bacteroidia bacterium]|nr:hypothetical protein [Bacteroidia bacterium]